MTESHPKSQQILFLIRKYQKYFVKNRKTETWTKLWWLMPVILTTKEAEIRRIVF
jgi:hypothetical protein